MRERARHVVRHGEPLVREERADPEEDADEEEEARVGERVWTWNAQWKRADGTCADHVVLPEAMAVRLPDHISFAEGACLGIPAMTAYQAVASAEVWAGSTLLVSGGAGGCDFEII